MTPTVASQSPAVAKMAEAWPMITALMGGTRAMRAAGQQLLPKWPGETDEAYKTRLSVSTLHNVFKRTVSVMSSRPFVQAAEIEPPLPASLQMLTEDCDLEGTDLDEYFADRFMSCMSHGVCGVLVDFNDQRLKGQRRKVRTVADEKAANARPYFAHYPCEAILGWKVRDHELVQIRLMESVNEDDGEFAEKTVQQVRVLDPGKWRTFRQNEKKEWVLYEEGTTTLSVVPFVFFYGNKLGFGIGESPLEDLAHQNVEHWQSTSDQQNILHVARVPILFASGFDGELKIGAGSVATSESAESDLKYVEHSGKAIEAGKLAIQALEDRMRHAGAELLVKRSATVTATEVRSDNEANKSILQTMVEQFEEGMESCLKLAAMWLGDKGYAPEVSLFKDFDIDGTLGDLATVLRARELGVIGNATVVEEMKRRGVLTDDAVALPDPPVEPTPTIRVPQD